MPRLAFDSPRLLFWGPTLIWASTWHVILYQLREVPALDAVAWRFVLASALVVYVLYRREFHSKALFALTNPNSVTHVFRLPERMMAELRLGERPASWRKNWLDRE